MTDHFWKSEIEKTAGYDIACLTRVAQDLEADFRGYYGEKVLRDNYKQLEEAHDRITGLLMKLRARVERLEAAE